MVRLEERLSLLGIQVRICWISLDDYYVCELSHHGYPLDIIFRVSGSHQIVDRPEP